MITNDIHNIIEDMYEARSKFRNEYAALNAYYSCQLEDNIKKAILNAIVPHIATIEIDFNSFNINIIFENAKVASDMRMIVASSVDTIIRSFLSERLFTDKDLMIYLNNNKNPLMDIFIIAECVKILI